MKKEIDNIFNCLFYEDGFFCSALQQYEEDFLSHPLIIDSLNHEQRGDLFILATEKNKFSIMNLTCEKGFSFKNNISMFELEGYRLFNNITRDYFLSSKQYFNWFEKNIISSSNLEDATLLKTLLFTLLVFCGEKLSVSLFREDIGIKNFSSKQTKEENNLMLQEMKNNILCLKKDLDFENWSDSLRWKFENSVHKITELAFIEIKSLFQPHLEELQTNYTKSLLNKEFSKSNTNKYLKI